MCLTFLKGVLSRELNEKVVWSGKVLEIRQWSFRNSQSWSDFINLLANPGERNGILYLEKEEDLSHQKFEMLDFAKNLHKASTTTLLEVYVLFESAAGPERRYCACFQRQGNILKNLFIISISKFRMVQKFQKTFSSNSREREPFKEVCYQVWNRNSNIWAKKV